MRDYGKVAPSFWTRGTGKQLRGDEAAQVLALYLMSCPASNLIGIYYLPFVMIGHETGLGAERAEAAMKHLERIGYAYYDATTEIVWVPGMPRYQVGEKVEANDKRRGGQVRSAIVKLGSHRFVRAFWKRYGVAYNLGPLPDGIEPECTPIEVECAAPQSSASTQEQEQAHEQEQEQEQEQEGVQGEPAPVAARAAPAAPGLFPQDPPGPEPKTRKRRAAPASEMREDWQPRPEHAESVRAAELSLGRVLADFRKHWMSFEKDGKKLRKKPADWDKTFENNTEKILRADWLRERFTVTASERLRANWPALEPEPDPASFKPPTPEEAAALEGVIGDLEGPTSTLREVAALDAEWAREMDRMARPEGSRQTQGAGEAAPRQSTECSAPSVDDETTLRRGTDCPSGNTSNGARPPSAANGFHAPVRVGPDRRDRDESERPPEGNVVQPGVHR